MNSFIIGVAGGSGSGKSTVTNHIASSIGSDNVAVLRLDSYYKSLSHLSASQRRAANFDHPNAFDWELLNKHLLDLYNGISIEMPTYNFAEDRRNEETVIVKPAKVVIFEGLFVLMEKSLRDLMSLKLFVDTAADIRFIRRLQRDMVDRNRSAESVINQYLELVRPMHKQFVEPTKLHADIIIPHGSNRAALEMIVARVRSVLNGDNIVLDKNIFEDDDLEI